MMLFRAFALAIALIASSFAGVAAVSAATPVPARTQSELDPVIGVYRAAFDARMESLPHYAFDLRLDPAISTIGGQATVTFPNMTETTLTEIPFRLYPNADYYDEGQTSIGEVSVNDRPVAPRYDDSGTVLFVDLPVPLPPGETVTIAMEFETVIPRNAEGSYGILNHEVAANRFVLADWYPIVAGWDETGWRLEPPTEQGDPTFSATSTYDLHLVLPPGYAVMAPGDEARMGDGSVRIVSGPVREFAMVVAEGMETRSAQAGDTSISVHTAPAHDANAQHVLDTAVAALNYYNENFGPYPFRELDLVETALSLAYGVSWSGVLFINENLLELAPDNLAALDFTVFHEIGHQWWGGTVGANSNDHTYMVEGLTNVTALLAQAAIQGPEAATDSLYAWIVTPYLNMLSGQGDGVADVPIFDQPATAPLSTLAYGKGALGFLAIREQIGDAAFRAGLANYADRYRLGIAEPENLRAAFETASGQSLEALWSLWFESATVTPADVEALVPKIVASFG